MSDILKALADAQAVKDAAIAAASERALAAEKAELEAKQAAWLARSPKEKHDDEIAAHRRWIANPGTASYFWVTIKDGVVTQEWDDICDCDDRAEHDASGHTRPLVWPERPFHLTAQPISTSQKLPSAMDLANAGHVYEIGVGDEPIWAHRNRFAPTTGIEEEAVVFGVRHADGFEKVTSVDHVGRVVLHDGYDASIAHVEPDSAFASKS